MRSNLELLQTNSLYLSSTDKQRRFVLMTLVEPKPCPNCGTAVDYFEGAGIEVDDLDLVKQAANTPCACPACKRGLVRTLPMLGLTWKWSLVPIPAPTEG